MLGSNDIIKIEQGDKCLFKNSKNKEMKGSYWYSDENGLVFYGEDGIMYKKCSFIKKIEHGEG